MRLTTSSAVVAFVVAAPGAAASRAGEGVDVRELLRRATTTSGAAIALPKSPLEVTMARYHIAPHAALPAHKHPYIRLGYVLSGSLSVTNLQTHHSSRFSAGDAIIEDIDEWHAALNPNAEAIELLVIDLAPPGAAKTIQPE